MMLSRFTALVVFVAALIICGRTALSADLAERWLFYGADLSKPEEIDDAVKMVRAAKAAGCTHIQFSEPITTGVFEAAPEYVAAAARIMAAAREAHINVVPGVFSIGYSGRYLLRNPNLAAGLPVRQARFKVSGGVALPDLTQAPALRNGGFEESSDGLPAVWSRQLAQGAALACDTAVVHSGKASLRIGNLDKIPRGETRNARIRQTLQVEPFKYYVVTLWVKSQDLRAEGEDYVVVVSAGGARRHSYTNLAVQATQDWTRHQTVFNTLDASEVEFSIGASAARGGTIWFDDVEIEPAGLLNVVDRLAAPFVVTDESGKVTYLKGADYEPVPPSDANDIYQRRAVAKPLVIMPGAAIKDGQTLLVSYYHTVMIYNDQLGCSLEDPAVFDMMELQMKNTARIWGANAYMMTYDEIRIAGWEEQPGNTRMKPGEMLARHAARALEIARKYAPDATLYNWSDMFTPYHNAYPFSARNRYYYLVNGNWDGSWEGLPKEIVIVNWSCNARGLKWFADKGHKQIMAGYYDGDPAESVRAWMEASKGIPGIMGMMYTTWRNNYADMPEFFRLLKEYPASPDAAPSREGK